jgi:signal recognition particle GTPase
MVSWIVSIFLGSLFVYAVFSFAGMFHKAVSTYDRNNKVNAILLTKFDTVSDKVGAALTMTHVTNAPILFVGTGQKYHHLQKLSTQSVIQSLFQ